MSHAVDYTFRMLRPPLARRAILAAVLMGAAGALVWTFTSRSGAAFDQRPVILISIDTLRADRLPAYGYTKVAHAEHRRAGRRGDDVRARLLARAADAAGARSMLSGELPFEHGVRDNVGFTVKPGQWLIQRALQERGWPTAAFVSAYVMRAGVGLNQGFDTYDSELPAASGDRSIGQVQRDGDGDAGRGREVAQAREPQEAVLPVPPRLRAAQALRAAAALRRPTIRMTARSPTPTRSSDGCSIACARWTSTTASTIVLLSDHGEGLGDHGEQEHGLFLYNATIQVPLIVKLPGQDRGAARGRARPAHRYRPDDPGSRRRAGAPGDSRPVAAAASRRNGHAGRHGHLFGGALLALPLRVERAVRADRRALPPDPRAARRALRLWSGIRRKRHRSQASGRRCARRCVRAGNAARQRVDRRAGRGHRRGSPAPGRARLRRRRQQHVAVAAGRLARGSEGQGPRAREVPARDGTGRPAAASPRRRRSIARCCATIRG